MDGQRQNMIIFHQYLHTVFYALFSPLTLNTEHNWNYLDNQIIISVIFKQKQQTCPGSCFSNVRICCFFYCMSGLKRYGDMRLDSVSDFGYRHIFSIVFSVSVSILSSPGSISGADKWSHCRSALNLRSSYWPAGGGSTGCKKKSVCMKVNIKMSLILTWFMSSVNWFQRLLWS